MEFAVVGSRNLIIQNLDQYIPSDATEIVTGGAKGIDFCAAEYAKENGLKLTVFKPEYEKYSKAAPLKRSELIIDHADKIIAIWDGKSKGTKYVIDKLKKGHRSVLFLIEFRYSNYLRSSAISSPKLSSFFSRPSPFS